MPEYTIKYEKETVSDNLLELSVRFTYKQGHDPIIGFKPEHCDEGESDELCIEAVWIDLPDGRYISVELDDSLESELICYIESNLNKIITQ